jgi:hypothetical protein
MLKSAIFYAIFEQAKHAILSGPNDDDDDGWARIGG